VRPDKLRLAILGCGEITRTQHLPAALSHPQVEITALVDSKIEIAQSVARDFHLKCPCVSEMGAVRDRIDVVINALPNALHARTTQEALRQGKHVLCEKPLATTSADARACSDLAREKRLVLAVGMNRRFDSNHRLLHSILREQQLGAITSYDWQYGGEFEWRSASGFYFSREMAGGGVLMDFGVHLLDSLSDWFGPVTSVEYMDDDWGGGIEANCILNLQHEATHGLVRGRVQLSRTVQLRNRLLIHGDLCEGEIRLGEAETVFLRRQWGEHKITESVRLTEADGRSSFLKQLDNFVRSVRGESQPAVDGEQAVHTLELIEWCYAHRTRIPEPWSETEPGMNCAHA
jgi:predicted dehydrogenase